MSATSTITGLTSQEVAERVAQGLTNKQNLDSSRSLSAILRANLFTLFNSVVGACFFVLLALGQFKDALFGLVVLFNILIGIIQEYRSKRTLDRLALLHSPLARVIRNSEIIEVRLEEVVLDDLLVLRAGDQLIADAKVLVAQNLEVDESLLTGESEPIEKQVNDELWSGSGVSGGKATAQVIRVGSDTYASKITSEARRFSLVASELRNSLNRIIRWITWVLVPIMLIVVNGQMFARGGWDKAIASGAWVDALVRSIAAIISMIPQGLVLLTSIAFAVAAVKLARNNVLVQELAAVEGLARVDVVCFDKTGTLTEGDIEFEAAHPLDNSTFHQWPNALAHFGVDPDANATARCLAEAFTDACLMVSSRVPFDSVRKWSSITTSEFNRETTWVLGAPEIVLGKQFAETQQKATELASTGRRTLVLAASKQRTRSDFELPNNLEPVALITFRERIRLDAAQTLSYFKSQGVSVRVISGDNPATVAAVARDAGLENAGAGFDARQLPEDPEMLADVMEQNQVFGRVTPDQKRNMVLALQSRGHTVAMTGDGVNDALALKSADLGIAMGSGAAATKAVSNLVLLDGKFASLPSVVDEGRRVIANVERVSRLFLNKTVWAMTLGLVFGAMLWSFPFLPRQLSIVDAFTIGIPAFALALLPNSRRYIPGFLKRSLAFCVPSGLSVAAAMILQDRIIHTGGDWQVAEAQTATALLLSVTGLWILVTLARPLNLLKIGILLTMFGLAVASFTIGWLVDFYGFAYLPVEKWLLPLALGSICAVFIETAHRLTTKPLQSN